MPTDLDLLGINRKLPSKDEKGWDAEVNSIFTDTCKLETHNFVLVGTNAIPCLAITTETLPAGGTITQVSPLHRISGNGGPVTLSAVTSINDGVKHGVLLYLVGTSNTNYVEIKDGSNVSLNGTIRLKQGIVLKLYYDAVFGQWIELDRNN